VGFGPMVKKISENWFTSSGQYLGYIQKEQLKKYLSYRGDYDFDQLVSLIQDDFNPRELKKLCEIELENNKEVITNSVRDFLFNLKNAISNKKSSRVQDYLIFVYSRLLAMNENRKLSLKKIFDSNSKVIKKELDSNQYQKLYQFCNSEKKLDRFDTINKFNIKYLNILDQDENNSDKSATIYLNISQQLFDKYKNINQFNDALFSFVKKAYDRLENHKSLVIKVGNIMSDGINIKWDIYSYLTIFAEKFSKIKEDRRYFIPEILCNEFLEYRYGIKLLPEEMKLLKDYYKKKISFEELQKYEHFAFNDSKKIIDELAHIYTGFTFIDCSILVNKKEYPNSEEVDFIKNKSELLLLFLKHKIDSRKIPCPICSSLTISGNSFPEIGIRSWECKNPLCSQRSKTNRGKRYSVRTIFMQNSSFDFSKENLISKKFIKKWRKDVIENQDLESLYTMITKYYSFVGDHITTVNAENEKKFDQVIKSEKRKPIHFKFEEFVGKINIGLFEEFFEKPNDRNFISHFIFEKKPSDKVNEQLQKAFYKNPDNTIITGDCRKVLKHFDENYIANMVTSPPYYNVREYTQWHNLYQYLHEMYEMISESYIRLQKGGVFFFNIGDIFDNEKIIVKSKMGEKRIPLGAYIILAFKKAGFELLDNVVWNKGEPQSQRHKNDGNYVPYYQRPANCYEHMFSFKKPGAKLKLNSNRKENPITENIQKFVPVYKIGFGGVNRYGHTAPFPENIPTMSVRCFTNPGEIVVDPYLGSGTTIIAAAKNGRVGIGIELNREYSDLSVNRIEKREIKVKPFYLANVKRSLKKKARVEDSIPA